MRLAHATGPEPIPDIQDDEKARSRRVYLDPDRDRVIMEQVLDPIDAPMANGGGQPE